MNRGSFQLVCPTKDKVRLGRVAVPVAASWFLLAATDSFTFVLRPLADVVQHTVALRAERKYLPEKTCGTTGAGRRLWKMQGRDWQKEGRLKKNTGRMEIF